MTIQILIVGAGAVGCFYGSRLHSEPNVLVSLVARSNYEAIHANGVILRTKSFGNYTFKPANVFPNLKAASTGTVWDYVVVTTKALPDISDDSKLITNVISPSRTVIVLIQNGVGIELPYQNRFPKNIILSAVTIISAEQVELGVIVQNRWTRIHVGPFTDGIGDGPPGPGDEKAKEFVRLLQQGEVKDAEAYDEKKIQMARWHKIAINASMNPSSVLSGGTGNARMSKDEELRTHLKECMMEIFRAARQILGEPFPASFATPDQILAGTERNTGGRPSMLLDWERGGQMELEVILGNPLRLAKSKGVDMPRLHTLYALLKMAQIRRDEEKAKL